jgi:hypothetical protein
VDFGDDARCYPNGEKKDKACLPHWERGYARNDELKVQVRARGKLLPSVFITFGMAAT